MYCPRCSQQQVSDETVFCSRCGFPLSTVRDLISGNGEGTLIKGDAGATLSKSERGMRKGMWVMIAGFPLIPIAAIIAAIDDVFVVMLILPALCFIFGFLRILYAAFLEKQTPAATDTKDLSAPYIAPPSAVQIGNTYNPGLPHPGTIPIKDSFIEQKRTTAKIVPPPSITEGTTKLLEEDE